MLSLLQTINNVLTTSSFTYRYSVSNKPQLHSRTLLHNEVPCDLAWVILSNVSDIWRSQLCALPWELMISPLQIKQSFAYLDIIQMYNSCEGYPKNWNSSWDICSLQRSRFTVSSHNAPHLKRCVTTQRLGTAASSQKLSPALTFCSSLLHSLCSRF